jgi:hypothetical protein
MRLKLTAKQPAQNSNCHHVFARPETANEDSQQGKTKAKANDCGGI